MGLFLLVGEECYSGADEDGGEPAAAVYVFVEEELGGYGVADEGEGGAGGGGEGDVYFAQGEEEGEEAERHAEDSGEEHGAGDYGADGSGEAGFCADDVEVADAAHGSGSEAVSCDGGEGYGEDGGPGFEGAGGGVGGHSAAPAGAASMLAGCAGAGCSVKEGPLATKPTPQTMRMMPTQRDREMCSCCQKWASSATTM